MDIDRCLRELYNELKRIDRTIARLEAQMAGDVPPRTERRGRHSMTPEERMAVSQRMSAYWARRRRGDTPPSTSH